MIKVLQSDCSGEYLSNAFSKHLTDTSTACRLTIHDSPQLNGVAEHLNHTLVEKVQALLHMAGLPQNLWGEALHHSTWLKNCTSMRALGGRTPWQAVYGLPPDLSGLKHFGEAVWVHDPNGSKLDLRACKGHWIGFDVESRGHHVYWSANRSVGIECNIYFAASAQLEGENMDIPTPKTLLSKLHTMLLQPALPLPVIPPQPATAPAPPS